MIIGIARKTHAMVTAIITAIIAAVIIAVIIAVIFAAWGHRWPAEMKRSVVESENGCANRSPG